ncbi:predicted protein [Naegleria gruberi]|uniref:Predicted protein n=1 Tax=Naegleria gruberi TaxID=5762 RepID=D2VSP4_NAEGR|nr:uncharacterized protein NAEGRDRAFT_81095 [Naegleria gruberi]EFC40159.1 predicted protein [Naegleria gruberi]|eukprot:XP_002672903.1 predicted protein [Naegleria gruberi strain NEG-M]
MSKKQTTEKKSEPTVEKTTVTSVGKSTKEVVKGKSWGRIIFSSYITLVVLLILFLILHLAHNHLVYQSNLVTQHDSRLKRLYKEGERAAPLFSQNVNVLPPAIVNPINQVIRLINDNPKVKELNINIPLFPINEFVEINIRVSSIPFIALLIAFAYTMTSKVPVILGQIIEGNGKLDNDTPREQQSKLTGFGSRALGAHNNAFEALIGFGIIVAVTLLRINGDSSERASLLALSLVKESICFIAARTVFQIVYVLGFPGFIRTLVWAFGWISVLSLYIQNAVY